LGKAWAHCWKWKSLETLGLICKQFLQFRVEINIARPLNPGFNLPHSSMEPLWISYCTICGLIRHKHLNCPKPPQFLPHVIYNIPLQAAASPGPRLIFDREESDSGMSSDGPALSHSKVTSSSSHGGESSHMQLVPQLSQKDMVCHVSTPLDLSFESSIECTRVEETVLGHKDLGIS